MKTIMVATTVVALVALGGCAGPTVLEGKYSEADGWRKGTVVEIGPAKSLKRPSFYDCRAEASDKERNAPYVMIAFRRNGHPYARAAKLHADSQLQVGDKVYVNFRDCNAPIPKRGSSTSDGEEFN
ncbi:MAG: hypothetical protein AzoDbin1_03793 [Azoarcus sp.]|uniref:Lipoprotein n=1 Tax=Aromatoleum toluolicum TaxID=90060 RepID=A0ABX1NGQ1_9RHOO|nr:hypothetical protein [Aromatoleum toluolicum]MCK9987321.1 hypothetical protein [Azoarcus sp.]NMF98460.1 hypothetical protein [Aromatoleum toluolicum]